MEHCDDEVIALVALGETPSPDDAAHLRSCAACGGEVDRLARVTVALRVPVDEGVPSELRLPVEPPPAVWEAIARATADGTTEGVAPVLPLRPRPARRGWLLPAAAALVVGVALGAVGRGMFGGESAPPDRVTEQVTLTALPADPGAAGRAEVVSTGQGRQLRLTVSGLTAKAGFYEVWLIDPTVTKMVPLGILPATGGAFVIPADIDLTQYPIVDVSAEPLDGDPAHSAVSVLRGTLPA